jgi:hypothetical protein
VHAALHVSASCAYLHRTDGGCLYMQTSYPHCTWPQSRGGSRLQEQHAVYFHGGGLCMCRSAFICTCSFAFISGDVILPMLSAVFQCLVGIDTVPVCGGTETSYLQITCLHQEHGSPYCLGTCAFSQSFTCCLPHCTLPHEGVHVSHLHCSA